MNTKVKSPYLRRMLVTAAVLLAAPAGAGAARADCPGQTPGNLEIELKAAITNIGTNNGTVVAGWRGCADPYFRAWGAGGVGSENLPVVAAAIGLYREPNAFLKNNDGTNSTVTYVQWWGQFLNPQTGTQEPPADRPKLRYFKGVEPFSNIYDGPVVTSVVSVRYWAWIKNNALLRDLSRKYLRANWAVYGFAAGKGPARTYQLDGRTPSATPAAHTQYNPNAPIRPDGDYYYSGHFLALPGARSNLGHWVGDDRFPLFDRAIQQPPRRTNENPPQKDVLNLLEGKWAVLAGPPAENLYALNSTERGAFNTLLTNGTNANTFLPWLAGFRTFRTFRVIGWSNFRASSMDGNPNFNTTCMYGVSYDSATQQASFLFPWQDKNGARMVGWARLEPGRIVASNDPGDLTHPYKVVSFPIPTTSSLFHIVLSPTEEPFNETTPPTFYPPRDPPPGPIDF